MPEFEDDQTSGLPDWLYDPIGLVRRRWLAIVIGLLIGLVATAGVAWKRKVLYKAEATVLLASQQVAEDLVKPTTPGNPIEGLDALSARALSQSNLKKVIESLKLYPDLQQEMSIDEVVAVMRDSIKVESRQNSVKTMPSPLRGERSRVLDVSFEDDDATVAAAVANQLAHLYQTEGLRMRGEQARLATEFMQRQVAEAETAMRDQKNKIAEYESQHRGELPSDLDTNQRRIERLHDQRSDLQKSAAEAEGRLAATASQTTSDSPSARLADARAQLAKELAVNTETHPNVVALRRQIDALSKEVQQGGGSGGGALGPTSREIAQYRAQIAAADQELSELDKRIARIPQHEAELVALQQRAKVLEDNYFSSLNKLNEAEAAANLEQAQQGAQVEVLEEAQPPADPEKGRTKIVLAGIVASFGLAVLAGIGFELRDPVIATAKGVETLSGVPVLGVVPRVS